MPEPTPVPAAEIITDVWWEEFVDADIEGKVEIFTEKLDDEALVDEDSFEMLTAIRSEFDTKHQSEDRVRYAALVQQLRNKKPDLFEHHAHYVRARLNGLTIWRIQCTTCRAVFTVLPHFVRRYRPMKASIAKKVLLATHGGLSLGSVDEFGNPRHRWLPDRPLRAC